MLSMQLDILTNAYLGKTSTNLFPLLIRPRPILLLLLQRPEKALYLFYT